MSKDAGGILHLEFGNMRKLQNKSTLTCTETCAVAVIVRVT